MCRSEPDYWVTWNARHGGHIWLWSLFVLCVQILARLMNYKMQGMVSGDMVERPMAWRRETDQDPVPLPWLHTQTELHRDMDSAGATDFVRSLDTGAVFMSPYSRLHKLQHCERSDSVAVYCNECVCVYVCVCVCVYVLCVLCVCVCFVCACWGMPIQYGV